jgi:hypothetical protein
VSDLTFYLGTHRPTWLWTVTGVPLFPTFGELRKRKTPFPRATTRWALDSGGFTELKKHGRWTISPEEYVAFVRRCRDELGSLDWASPQDWMCEPWIIEGGTHNGQHYIGTGLSVAEHQARTVENYLHLTDLAPDLPFIPVLQGWEMSDYFAHADAYSAAGVDLSTVPIVGIGSVCRRQATGQIADIFDHLRAYGLSMHGFGVKTAGLSMYADNLVSADSLAWSYGARQDARAGIRHCAKKTCANCLHYALSWRERVLRGLEGRQMSLSLYGGAA